MNPEQLTERIAARNPAALADALAALTESQRRKLSRTASTLYRAARREERRFRWGRSDEITDETIRKLVDKAWHLNELIRMAGLAVLGVCPFSESRRVEPQPAHLVEYSDAMRRILLDRRPEWIERWFSEQLDRDVLEMSWTTARTLVREGICRRPQSDGYIRLFAGGMISPLCKDSGRRPLVDRLRDAPDLLGNEVWRLFELDSAAFVELSASTIPPQNSWSEALKQLAAEGQIDRGRLLDATLAGLTRPLQGNTLSGFARFFEFLKPTAQELLERQNGLMDLLHSTHGPVVTAALKFLRKIQSRNGFAAQQFLLTAEPVFELTSKTQAKTALTLADRIVKDDTGLADRAADLAVCAFRHSSSDIHEIAVDCLSRWRTFCREFPATPLAEWLDHMSAAARLSAAALLDELGVTEGVETETGSAPAAQNAELDQIEADLQRRIAELSTGVRERYAIDECLKAIGERRLPPPLSIDPMRTGVFPFVEPLEPIVHVDELLDRVAQAVEVIESADEVECLLDGISRLCDQRSSSFGMRAAPLIQRIQSAASEGQGLVAGASLPAELHRLLLTWLSGGPRPKPLSHEHRLPGLLGVANLRMRELRVRVQRKQAAPLVAAPTHSHGWIDPRVAIERLIWYQQRELQPGPRDVTQALLRLAPDSRDDALQAAGEVTGDIGRLVRWALGADEGPGKRDAAWAPLWVAAGRARWPRSHVGELAACGGNPEWPDVIAPARYTWKIVENDGPGDYWAGRSIAGLDVSVEPGVIPEEDWNARREQAVASELETLQDELAAAGLDTADRPTDAGPDLKDRLPLVRNLVDSFVQRLARATARAESSAAGTPDIREYPTVARHHHAVGSRWEWGWSFSTPWAIRWRSMVWPGNQDAILLGGARALMGRIDMPSSTFEPNHIVLEWLESRELAWNDLACLPLCLGLLGKDTVARTLAVDVLISGIEDGRANAGTLSAVLTRLNAAPWMKLNRLAHAFSEVAGTSPLAELFVAEVLQEFLGRFPETSSELPRDLHHLLTLLSELLVRCALSVSEPCAALLRRVGGSGKTARLARRILEQSGNAEAPRRREALLQALAGRVQIAEQLTL